jgi:hypothetical protein
MSCLIAQARHGIESIVAVLTGKLLYLIAQKRKFPNDATS